CSPCGDAAGTRGVHLGGQTRYFRRSADRFLLVETSGGVGHDGERWDAGRGRGDRGPAGVRPSGRFGTGECGPWPPQRPEGRTPAITPSPVSPSWPTPRPAGRPIRTTIRAVS